MLIRPEWTSPPLPGHARTYVLVSWRRAEMLYAICIPYAVYATPKSRQRPHRLANQVPRRRLTSPCALPFSDRCGWKTSRGGGSGYQSQAGLSEHTPIRVRGPSFALRGFAPPPHRARPPGKRLAVVASTKVARLDPRIIVVAAIRPSGPSQTSAQRVR